MAKHKLEGKRVVAYVRISSDGQDGGSESQEEALKRFARRNNITILKWYCDNQGKNPRGDGNRPLFQQMIKDAKKGIFDVILVHYQKRLGLFGHYFGKYMCELLEHDVHVWSVQGDRDLSSEDPAELHRTFQDTISCQTDVSEHGGKVLEREITAARKGLYHGGIPPYGCDVVCYDDQGTEKWRTVFFNRHRENKDTGEIIQDGLRRKIYPDGRMEEYKGKHNVPRKDRNDVLRLAPSIVTERTDAVKKIFHWYDKQRTSASKIAARLSGLGIEPVETVAWHGGTISGILKNPVYIGKPVVCKRTGARFTKRDKNGKIELTNVKAKRKSMAILTEDYWVWPDEPVFPPIVDEDIFLRVQEKFRKRKYEDPRQVARYPENWLKDILVCGRCAKPMNFCFKPINHKKDKKEGKPIRKIAHYRCGSYAHRGGKINPFGCQSYFIKLETVKTIIDNYLEDCKAKIEFDKALEEMVANVEGVDVLALPPQLEEPDPELLEELKTKIQRLEEANKEIWHRAKFFGDDIALNEAKKEMRENTNEVNRLKIELEEVSKRRTKEELEELIAKIEETKIDNEYRVRRELIGQIIKRVYLFFEDIPCSTGKRGDPKYRLKRVVIIPVSADERALGEELTGVYDDGQRHIKDNVDVKDAETIERFMRKDQGRNGVDQMLDGVSENTHLTIEGRKMKLTAK